MSTHMRTHMSAAELVTALRETRGFAHKRDIAGVLAALAGTLPGGAHDMAQAVAVGDDCAAIPDPSGKGYLLFAIEGFVEDFVKAMPWFAGYCGVMVNVSDIYAMGGRPIAIVDALWSAGLDGAEPILRGMAEASARYAVPIVGGHTNNRSERGQLAVAILGRAERLLTSFDARPGDRLVFAIDLRGAYQEPYAYWNASTEAPAQRLRADLEILPGLAEGGLCDAGKDISMAGAVGTALMLLEASGCGATIDVDAIPRPVDVPLLRWLTSFPSYGFVLSVRPGHCEAVLERFSAHGIACAVAGEVDDSARVSLSTRAGQDLAVSQQRDAAADTALLWEFDQSSFIGATPARQRDVSVVNEPVAPAGCSHV
jgi:uncharacterized protein